MAIGGPVRNFVPFFLCDHWNYKELCSISWLDCPPADGPSDTRTVPVSGVAGAAPIRRGHESAGPTTRQMGAFRQRALTGTSSSPAFEREGLPGDKAALQKSHWPWGGGD